MKAKKVIGITAAITAAVATGFAIGNPEVRDGLKNLIGKIKFKKDKAEKLSSSELADKAASK